MALTKIQPSGLDQSQNYSVNQVSANTVLVNGVNIYAFANAAFTSANAAGSSATVTAAFDQANAAFAKANTGSSGGATNARAMINSYIFGY